MKAHRMRVTFGLAIASAVVLAASAQAATRPDDRGGMLGVGATQVVPQPDVFERAVQRATETAPPDVFERAVLRRSSVQVRPDDRAGARGPGAVGTTLAPSATSAETGVTWSDAALGVAGMLGILLLGTAVTLTIRRRRSVLFS